MQINSIYMLSTLTNRAPSSEKYLIWNLCKHAAYIVIR